MNLSEKHTRAVLFIVGEELARRRRTGAPIPALLLDVHRALTRDVGACASEPFSAATDSPKLENVKQRARRLGESVSSVRRTADQTGALKCGRDWVWISDN